MSRAHVDRCPGVLRPWIAADGAIVRLRLIGGEITTAALRGLLDVAEQFGDGSVLMTTRTNLQLRGIAADESGDSPCVSSELVDAVSDLGLLPSPTHELIRNIVVSPLSGRIGGMADLRSVAHDLDQLVCADPRLAGLPGRFLFVLDDGRGDIAHRPLDLGLVAEDDQTAHVRIGSHNWGPKVRLSEAADTLLTYARAFLTARGVGATAAWHVDELPGRGVELFDAAGPGLELRHADRTPFGPLTQDDGLFCNHVAVPDGVLTRATAEPILDQAGPHVIVTPWRSLLLPDQESP